MAGEMDKEDIEYFLSIGALEFSHYDEDGEAIYSLTEQAEELAPELYDEQIKDFNAITFSLWNKGAIEIVFDEDGEPLISIKEDSIERLQDPDLDEEEKDVLEQIIYSWNIKNSEE